MFFFTETLNVSRPVTDCLDQIQRAAGMGERGQEGFSPLSQLPGSMVVQASGALRFPKCKGKVLQHCCHMDIVTLMGPVTVVSAGMLAGNDEAWVPGSVGIAG